MFWSHLKNLDMNQHSDRFGAFQRYILNINPEGVLLREAHDIMDELKMMRRVYAQQLDVVTDFLKHLQDLHDQESPPEREFLLGLTKMIQEVIVRKDLDPNSVPATRSKGKTPLPNGAPAEIQAVQKQPDGMAALPRETAADEETRLQNGLSTTAQIAEGQHSETPAPTEGAEMQHSPNVHHNENSQPEEKVPKTTLNRAKALIQVIAMRRDELQDHEDTTKDVANQVRNPLVTFHDLSTFLSSCHTNEVPAILIEALLTKVFSKAGRSPQSEAAAGLSRRGRRCSRPGPLHYAVHSGDDHLPAAILHVQRVRHERIRALRPRWRYNVTQTPIYLHVYVFLSATAPKSSPRVYH